MPTDHPTPSPASPVPVPAAVRELTDTLRELYDAQNGPPLPGRHEERWNDAMAKARALLAKYEPLVEASPPQAAVSDADRALRYFSFDPGGDEFDDSHEGRGVTWRIWTK